MKVLAHKLRLIVSLVLLYLPVDAWSQGGGIAIYEIGTPDMGLSYAGAVARAQDAATAHLNPAGMTRLDGHQHMVGLIGIYSDLELELGSDTISDPPGGLNGGGSAGSFVPAIGSYHVWSIKDDWRIGWGTYGLFGGAIDYDSDWVGRGFVTEASMTVLATELTVGKRINEQFSLGAGISANYAVLDFDLRASNDPAAGKIKIDDADDIAPAFQLSAMYEPTESTRIGIRYYSSYDLDMSGDLKNPLGIPADVDVKLDMPQGVTLGIYHQLNEKWAVLGDVGWTDWSKFSAWTIEAGPISIPVDRQFDDTWRLGLGAQYQLNEKWLLSSGIGYDSDALEDDIRLPDLPTSDQLRMSIGAQYKINERTTIGASYTFVNMLSLDLDNVGLPPTNAVVLDGKFDDHYIHFFGITADFKF